MAQILAIDKTRPIKNERYLIDTNVWFWFTYVASKQIILPNHPSQYQIKEYPLFIESLLRQEAILCHTSLTLTELANVIENTEFELYKSKENHKYLSKKDFRKLPAERGRVLKEIHTAWETIDQISKCISCMVNREFIGKSYKIMESATVDPFDALYLQIMDINQIDYVVSDDIDYSYVSKNILLTANTKALNGKCN